MMLVTAYLRRETKKKLKDIGRDNENGLENREKTVQSVTKFPRKKSEVLH
jgi:hypothetical protein